jgi:transposase-like protein
MADLKRVYKASNKELACSELDRLEERWSKKYPIVIRSWRNNWENLSQYFKYPKEIRRII